MTLGFLLFTVVLLLLVEGFFSGSEIAFLSVNRPRLWQAARKKDRRAILAKQLLNKPEHLFSTTVVGTTLAICGNTTIVALYILQTLGSDWEWLNLVALTPVVLIFGEFVPKMVARSHADFLVPHLARPLNIMGLALFPLTRLFSLYAHILKKILGEKSDRGFFLNREEIKAALPASHGSDVTPAERELITRFLEFGRITAKEMLRPLIDVIAIDESESLEAAMKLFRESGHSRLPVFSERVDRVVGVLRVFDCLSISDLSQPVRQWMVAPLFVPESKPIDELFEDLKNRPLAVVVNEFGGAEGIITMEDVMEEVVGEIEDEYDEPPKLYHQIGRDSYVVNARMEVDDLREQLKIPIPKDDDYQTLAGFLLKRMQKIPKKWDSITIDNVEYVVQNASDKSIEEVYVIMTNRS